eukprot:GEZU01028408.1.p1 GENE.GEZU01028408.1~~GEZU01028408.1.p1  ORF type:complete len:205 (-),score=32.53 GEZU01028408.1:78-638(-)
MQLRSATITKHRRRFRLPPVRCSIWSLPLVTNQNPLLLPHLLVVHQVTSITITVMPTRPPRHHHQDVSDLDYLHSRLRHQIMQMRALAVATKLTAINVQNLQKLIKLFPNIEKLRITDFSDGYGNEKKVREAFDDATFAKLAEFSKLNELSIDTVLSKVTNMGLKKFIESCSSLKTLKAFSYEYKL